MEDPVSFDVWAKVNPRSRSVAVKEITSIRPVLKQTEVRLLVNRSVAKDESILVAEDQGWDFVQAFQKLSSDWLEDIRVYQSGWKPEDRTKYCGIHKLNHGGCLGCHVCRGFFVR